MKWAGADELMVAEYRVTGSSSTVRAELDIGLGLLWQAPHRDRLTARQRKRVVGDGAKRKSVFVDRLLATLVNLRHGTSHDVLACWFGVDRSATRATGEVWRRLVQPGCAGSGGVRLRSLAGGIGRLGDSNQAGIVDGTELRVRRPAEGRQDRDRPLSGKAEQNAVKSIVSRTLRSASSSATGHGRAVAGPHTGLNSSGWSSSWPTACSRRSSRMPAVRAWAHRQANGW
ncbi:helix-turn-helix domain-containing protein [Streptomyces netropsis]